MRISDIMKYIFPVLSITFLLAFCSCIGCLFYCKANAKALKVKTWNERIEKHQQSNPSDETIVYLSSDKDIYIAGESILYNAFVLNAKTPELTGKDRVLYLQVVNAATDSTVWKEMYPISDGISYGRVNLASTLPTGKYLLRAFTAHSFFRHQPSLYAVKPIQIVKEASAIRHGWRPADEPPFPGKERLTVRVTTVKDTYTTKDKVTLKITTTDENGTPRGALVSLKVYDRLFHNPAFDHDIVKYFYDKRESMTDKQPFLSDSIYGQMGSKKPEKQSLMLFNYEKSKTDFISTDDKGRFALGTNAFSIGHRFFIKYFSEKELTIRIADPFDTILAMHFKDKYDEKVIPPSNSNPFTNRLQYNHLLKEIVVQSKGRQFGDPYVGYLDSVAKFEGNTDYVGECGWLNCPACGHGTKPVEGTSYSELKPEKKLVATSHPFPFGPDDYVKKPYQYPRYTEAELLKKFKMVVTRGFYPQATFYSPDYERDDKQLPDNRNVLYWHPSLMTNSKGEATITFYTSDIQSTFIGIAEAIGLNGYAGSGTTEFSVR